MSTFNEENNQQQEKEKKESVSAGQQILNLKEEIKELKILLRKREATIQGIQNIINNILEMSETKVNKVHKALQKNIVFLTDSVGEELNSALMNQFHGLDNLTIEQQKKLCNDFRNGEKLNPLVIPEEEIPAKPTTTGEENKKKDDDVNKSKKG